MPYKNKTDLYHNQKRRWNKIKQKAITYLGGKCVDCKKTDLHPALYDFHHKDGEEKECQWAKLRLRSWDRITKELDKCELLCVLCHRLRHIDPDLW
jgi:hypothetical protein